MKKNVKKRDKPLTEIDSQRCIAALKAADAHLRSSTIPDVLRPVLLQAEANWRGNAGAVIAIAAIDFGRLLVDVPDGCEQRDLAMFLWDALLRSDGHSIQFAYVGQDDSLRVVYMDRDLLGFTAFAQASGSNLGEWTLTRMPLQESATVEGDLMVVEDDFMADLESEGRKHNQRTNVDDLLESLPSQGGVCDEKESH